MGTKNRIRWHDVDKSQADLQLALDALQQTKALKSARTRGWYQSNVGAFRAWLVDTGQPVTLSEISAEMVHAYLAEEAVRPYRLVCRQRRDHY